MALTYSTMLPLGTKLIDFSLLNTTNNSLFSTSQIISNKPVLIMIICNHCPYVIHYHDEFKRLHNDYSSLISFLAISSNDADNYPEDSPNKMKELWDQLGFSFPYLYDESQEVAKAFQAECTPEFYLFNNDHILAYRGRCDDTTPKSNKPTSGKDLREALNAVLANETPCKKQHPSMGCNIKWKSVL